MYDIRQFNSFLSYKTVSIFISQRAVTSIRARIIPVRYQGKLAALIHSYFLHNSREDLRPALFPPNPRPQPLG